MLLMELDIGIAVLVFNADVLKIENKSPQGLKLSDFGCKFAIQ